MVNRENGYKNIMHLAGSSNSKVFLIKKHPNKLKEMSLEMPSAPYLNRYASG
jgi:hypothetical protein